MNYLKSMTMILVLIGAVSCGQKPEENAPQNSSVQKASAGVAPERAVAEEEVKHDESLRDAGSGWSLNNEVDKMTDAQKNKLTKSAATEQHLYQVTFECDVDGIGVKIETYAPDNQNAPIPWDIQAPNALTMTNKYTRVRPFRVRYGDKIASLNLRQSDYGNVGRVVLNAADELLSTMAALSGDRNAKVAMARSKYESMLALLSKQKLNIADVFPGEVVELNPDSARNLVDSFLKKCDEAIPKPAPKAEKVEDKTQESLSSSSEKGEQHTDGDNSATADHRDTNASENQPAVNESSRN